MAQRSRIYFRFLSCGKVGGDSVCVSVGGRRVVGLESLKIYIVLY